MPDWVQRVKTIALAISLYAFDLFQDRSLRPTSFAAFPQAVGNLLKRTLLQVGKIDKAMVSPLAMTLRSVFMTRCRD